MTFTTYDTPANIVAESPDTLRAAALAASRSLPASGGVTVEAPHVLADAPPLHHAPGAQAVTVAVTGTAVGHVTLVVADDVADALRAGPLGADELVNALTTPLTDAVAELEAAVAGPLHVGIADAVIAEALDFPTDAVAVTVLDGTTPIAALVVELRPADDDQPTARPQETGAFTALVDEPTTPSAAARPLDLLHDVEMAVTVELGRTRMAVRDLLSLAPGAVVELDRAAGSPVDVLVNGKLIARGEVVVIDDDFGIRISEIIGLRPNHA